VQIAKDGGQLKATTYSLDEGAQPFGGTVSLTGQSFKLPIPGLRDPTKESWICRQERSRV
jgi:hypothetical protein